MKMTTDPTQSGVDLPLMTDYSFALVKCYQDSIKEYFGKENLDHLLAMILNSFMELFEKSILLFSDMMKEVTNTKHLPLTTVASNVEQTT